WRGGRTVATVPAADATPRSLAALMVGREIELGRRNAPRDVGETCLELDGVSADGDRGLPAVKQVSLHVRRGEIVAVAGVAGNGQRELAEAIAGMRTPTAGTIRVSRRKLKGGDAREASSARIAYVPHDPLGPRPAPRPTAPGP